MLDRHDYRIDDVDIHLENEHIGIRDHLKSNASVFYEYGPISTHKLLDVVMGLSQLTLTCDLNSHGSI